MKRGMRLPPSEQKLKGDESPPTERQTWTSSGPRLQNVRKIVHPLKDYYINKVRGFDNMDQIVNQIQKSSHKARGHSKLSDLQSRSYLKDYYQCISGTV
jgi:hypothetical protein